MNAKRIVKHRRQSLQVIAGKYRRRRIDFVAAEDLRPTGVRIRETLFNWLAPVIVDKTCLDLFAGSGILGIEALSHGARHVTFVERNKDVFRQLQNNITKLNIVDATLLHADFTTALHGHYEVIFLDPPYNLRLLPTLLQRVKLLSPHYVFIEDNQPFETWANNGYGYQISKSKKAGGIYYGLLSAIQA